MKLSRFVQNTGQMEEMAALFKAMSDPHRLSIMCCLLDRECCVGELSRIVHSSLSAVSHQLKQLRLARLVSRRREGKTIYYYLHDHHIHQLMTVAHDHVKESSAAF